MEYVYCIGNTILLLLQIMQWNGWNLVEVKENKFLLENNKII